MCVIFFVRRGDAITKLELNFFHKQIDILSYMYLNQKMARPYLLKKPDGTQEWFLNYNELHRLDGPAVIMPDGTTKWFRNGKCHREDGPAIESPDGARAWYYKGLNHRENGPAVEYNDGSKFWYYHGSLHRVGGPAVYHGTDYINDDDFCRWYLYGEEMEEEQYNKVMRTCKRAIAKLKSRLRKTYVEKLKETDICDEINLYNIIAEYVI